jgi:hypothetical protein
MPAPVRKGASWRNALGEQSASIALFEMFAAPLRLNAQTRGAVTCTNPDTDYLLPAPPSWARYVTLWAAAAAYVAVDEPTTATVGAYVPAGTPITYPVFFDPSGDGAIHVRSPVGGTVVNVGYLGE